jgi:hypothetical protein
VEHVAQEIDAREGEAHPVSFRPPIAELTAGNGNSAVERRSGARVLDRVSPAPS